MKIKTQLTLASVIAAGLLASGCSSQQLVAQPAAVVAPLVQAPPAPVTETITNTIVDCSKCSRPAPPPPPRAVPMPPPPPPPPPRPIRPVNPNAHTHPAIPNCTASVRHVHPGGNRGHNHNYACQQRPRAVPRPTYVQPVPVMPKVKAKGTYRGPIKIDGVMQQYQQY